MCPCVFILCKVCSRKLCENPKFVMHLQVLKSMGVNLKDARVETEKIIGRGSGFVAVEIPFTPRAKRVLELSLEEARQLGKLAVSISLYAGLHACQCSAPELAAADDLRRLRSSAALQGTTILAQSMCSWAFCGRARAWPHVCWKLWELTHRRYGRRSVYDLCQGEASGFGRLARDIYGRHMSGTAGHQDGWGESGGSGGGCRLRAQQQQDAHAGRVWDKPHYAGIRSTVSHQPDSFCAYLGYPKHIHIMSFMTVQHHST